MANVVDFLVDQFLHNQFATAAVLAAPAALITYSARAVPRAMWSGLKKLVSVEIRLNSDMEAYYKAQQFLTENIILGNLSRNFTYRYERQHQPGETRAEDISYVAMGYGNHLGMWRGKPVWVNRYQSESSATDRFKESTEITLLGRGAQVAQQFLKQMEAYVSQDGGAHKVTMFTNSTYGWSRMGKLQPRPLNTVITSCGAAEKALDYIQQFKLSEQKYLALGVPYHTGLLLLGEPGTGKTSLIQALATETKRDLFYLNLASITEESGLPELLSRDWTNSILVIEDIDASRVDVDRSAKSGNISLAVLLNMLDGLLSPNGMVVIATTNHQEKLDPALVRPGRFDLVLQIGKLTWDGFTRLAALYGYTLAQLAPVAPYYAPTAGAQARALLSQGLPAVEHHFGLNATVDATS